MFKTRQSTKSAPPTIIISEEEKSKVNIDPIPNTNNKQTDDIKSPSVAVPPQTQSATLSSSINLDEIFEHRIPAPDLVGLENWINSEPIHSLETLKGKVVLLNFWTLGCINCIHTLPSLNAWHKEFSDDGLVILGIHSPEFQYERKLENVKNAVQKYHIKFPVVQDNDFKTWRAYKNRYWPAEYLIDKEGFVRYFHFGEGNYETTRTAIQVLLKS